jgi:hypothetical protein
MPTQSDLLDHLGFMHASSTGSLPEALPAFPPALPKQYWNTDFANITSVGLLADDIDIHKQIRSAPLQRILTAMQIKHYRAIGLPPPTQYRVHTSLMKLSTYCPELPRGDLISVSPAMEPIKIITSSPDNWQLITDKAANTGVPVIPDLSHQNNCRCMALYANNNYESLQPVRSCLPVEMYKEYPESRNYPSAQEMGFAAPVYKNLSDMYMSEVSSAGTVLLRQIRREPVTRLKRSKPTFKKPQWNFVDIASSDTLSSAITANMSRDELSQFTARLNQYAANSSDSDITRFRPLGSLSGNIDVTSYGTGIESLEEIIINEPLVDAFYGKQKCSFCPTTLFLEDASELLTHFMQEHMVLLDAYFTCPACLVPAVIHSTRYAAHYRIYHAKATALMFILNEISIHSRAQHAHILNLFIIMGRELNILPTPSEKPKYVSPLGGWSICDPAQLEEDVLDAQFLMKPSFKGKPNSKSRPKLTAREQSPDWEVAQGNHHRNRRQNRPAVSQPQGDSRIEQEPRGHVFREQIETNLATRQEDRPRHNTRTESESPTVDQRGKPILVSTYVPSTEDLPGAATASRQSPHEEPETYASVTKGIVGTAITAPA